MEGRRSTASFCLMRGQGDTEVGEVMLTQLLGERLEFSRQAESRGTQRGVGRGASMEV